MSLCSTHCSKDMIDTSRVKVQKHHLGVVHFSTVFKSFFKISRVLIWIMNNINTFLLVIMLGFVFKSIEITNYTSNFGRVSKIGLIESIGSSINKNDILRLGLKDLKKMGMDLVVKDKETLKGSFCIVSI